jgi:hypothetical protein
MKLNCLVTSTNKKENEEKKKRKKWLKKKYQQLEKQKDEYFEMKKDWYIDEIFPDNTFDNYLQFIGKKAVSEYNLEFKRIFKIKYIDSKNINSPLFNKNWDDLKVFLHFETHKTMDSHDFKFVENDLNSENKIN